VHLVVFITRIYHDPRHSECQKHTEGIVPSPLQLRLCETATKLLYKYIV